MLRCHVRQTIVAKRKLRGLFPGTCSSLSASLLRMGRLSCPSCTPAAKGSAASPRRETARHCSPVCPELAEDGTGACPIAFPIVGDFARDRLEGRRMDVFRDPVVVETLGFGHRLRSHVGRVGTEQEVDFVHRQELGVEGGNIRRVALLFHHLVRRHRAPQIRGLRRFRPCLRPLWVVAMPGLGVEIAERLVLHLVELGEQLRDQPVRAAMVGEEIVADAVPSGAGKSCSRSCSGNRRRFAYAPSRAARMPCENACSSRSRPD